MAYGYASGGFEDGISVVALALFTLPFAVGGWWHLWYAGHYRIRVNEHSIERTGTFGRRLELPWSEITEVEWSDIRVQLTLHASGKRSLRIDSVRGMLDLLDIVERHLPPHMGAKALDAAKRRHASVSRAG